MNVSPSTRKRIPYDPLGRSSASNRTSCHPAGCGPSTSITTVKVNGALPSAEASTMVTAGVSSSMIVTSAGFYEKFINMSTFINMSQLVLTRRCHVLHPRHCAPIVPRPYALWASYARIIEAPLISNSTPRHRCTSLPSTLLVRQGISQPTVSSQDRGNLGDGRVRLDLDRRGYSRERRRHDRCGWSSGCSMIGRAARWW